MEQHLRELAALGLNIFASCRVDRLPEEITSALTSGGITLDQNQSLCVIGHGGKTLWTHLPKPVWEADHPVDNFVLRHVNRLNETVFKDSTLKILYPSPEHQIPLQKIGRFLNIGRPSLLGLDINSGFGVWFAYRAAFLTNAKVPEKFWTEFRSPCDTCDDKPCRAVCPSGAVGVAPEKFNLSACAVYRFSENSKCGDRCLSRMNCSYKPEHQYPLEQQQYHMGRTAHLARLRVHV